MDELKTDYNQFAPSMLFVIATTAVSTVRFH